jgi:hypothetical protein
MKHIILFLLAIVAFLIVAPISLIGWLVYKIVTTITGIVKRFKKKPVKKKRKFKSLMDYTVNDWA